MKSLSPSNTVTSTHTIEAMPLESGMCHIDGPVINREYTGLKELLATLLQAYKPSQIINGKGQTVLDKAHGSQGFPAYPFKRQGKTGGQKNKSQDEHPHT